MNRKKVALITGITGQDGALLAELLLTKGYEVHGIKRRSSSFNTKRIDHLYKDRHEEDTSLFLHFGDLADSASITRVIKEIEPDEIYNMGAMSHVHASFENPVYTADVVAVGALRVLESIRLLGMENKIKFYQASSSEMYGKVLETPQKETTPFYPRSPYAAAKVFAHWITVNYRESYGMFACSGILFNHESPTRGETFVTRKITRAISDIIFGFQEAIYLGNLEAKRDWGHAKDYVEAIYLIMQQKKAQDFVIGTESQYSVREFLVKSWKYVGITLKFVGEGLEEKGIIESIDEDKFKLKVNYDIELPEVGKVVVEIKEEYYRPAEVDSLEADTKKAREVLGWKPRYKFEDIIAEMIDSDLTSSRKKKIVADH